MHTLLAIITAASAWAWVLSHQLALYYVGAVLVEQLPPPDSTSGKVYRYAYSVIQILAANLRRTNDAVRSAPAPTPAPPASKP